MPLPSAPGPHASTGLHWLVLDLNSFFASCEQQERPELRGKPVIVVPVMTDSTCAIAASYEAKKFGIKTGTPVWEAKKKCPGLHLLQARPKLYVEYHHRILAAIESCLPIEKTMSIDEVACRLDKTQQTDEAARAIAQKIKDMIRTQVGQCLTSSVGIGGNILLAKLASNMQKPDGLTLLPHTSLPHAITHLPIQAIPGIGTRMAKRLADVGIEDIQSLWDADTQYLRRIWGGVTGVRFHSLLHGADLTPLAQKRSSIGHQHVLAPRERSMTAATPTIRQLLTKAAQRLRQDGYYCRYLGLDIKWTDHRGHYYADCRFHETQDTNFLLHQLDHLWRQAPQLGPLRIGVMLGALVAQGAHQADLFDTNRPKKLPGTLDKALDALNDKFGRGTITYGATGPRLISKIAFQRVPELHEF